MESDHGIFLLFAKGKRPDRDAIHRFASAQSATSISFDPTARPHLRLVKDGEESAPKARDTSPEANWIELIRHGMVFDLEGLANSPPKSPPLAEFRYDFPQPQSIARYEAIRLVPGEHLIAGAGTLPVMRSLIALTRELAHGFEDIEAIVWPPARSVIGRRFFESTSTAWLDGGAFPALGLTSFFETLDGGLQSVGLDYFIGQELRIEPSLATEKGAATRLAIRLVNQLVVMGGIHESERVIAPDGTRLVMRPSRNKNFIRVWGE